MLKLSAVLFCPLRIETERLTLRGYESSELADIYEYASVAETTRFVAWERAMAPDDIDAFLNSAVAPNYERQELDYAMTLRRKEHRRIGGMGLYWRPREHQVMELGCVLHRACWGHGSR